MKLKLCLVFSLCLLFLCSCTSDIVPMETLNDSARTRTDNAEILDNTPSVATSIESGSAVESEKHIDYPVNEEEESDYLVINDTDSESTKVAKQFIKAVKVSDYGSIYNLLHLNVNNVLSLEDIKTWIENSDLIVLQNNEEVFIRMYYENNNVLMTETVYGEDANKENIKVYYELNEENNWIPVLSNLYHDISLEFKVKGHLIVDDKEMTDVVNNDDKYVYNFISPNKMIHIKYVTDNFGDIESDLYVLDIEKNYPIDLKLSTEQQSKVLSSFNSLFSHILSGVNSGERDMNYYKKDFSNSVNSVNLEKFISLLSSFQKEYNITSDITCKDLQLSRLNSSLVLNDKTVSIIVNFKLSFDSPGSNGIEKRNIEVDMEVQEDGSYKIANIFM